MSNQQAAGPNNPYFFVSYFHRDAKDNVWFKEFYEDLTKDVAREANLPVDVPYTDIRFFDREGIQTGDRWDITLAEALRASRVFVPVYSAGYFKSEYCGKEFRVFYERVREYEEGKGLAQGDAPLIIPVLWGPPNEILESLPKPISSIQFTDASFGDMYAEFGLEYLLRMGKNQTSDEYKAYQKFLLGIRRKIVAEATRHPMPRANHVTPLEDVCSAFASDSTAAGVVAAAGAVPDIAGPEVAWFVYVAGRPADFANANIQRSPACYGQAGGPEWQPYLPNTQKKIGVIATSVASDKEVFPQLLPVSDRLIEQLQEAEEKNTIVVLIIDPWSLQLYRKPLSAYDKTRLSNSGIIVLWNDNDPETRQRRQPLQAELRQTFSRNLISRDVFFQESGSEAELRDKLGAAIDDVYRKVNERAKLVRGTVAEGGGPIPKLPVPSGNGSPTGPAATTGGGGQ
jgi:FxsC-like protein